MTSSRNRPSRAEYGAVTEGIFTGLLGASVVAVFYFGLDAVRGQPLMTPSVLGQAYLFREIPTTTSINPAAILAYSSVHVAAFIAFGVLLAFLVRAAERTSLARYAVVQLFIVFELFFYGVLLVGSEQTRGMFALWGVLAANTLATISMGLWQWRHHPMLRLAARATPLGATNPTGD